MGKEREVTDLRKAAQQALEALENGKRVRAGEGGTKCQISLEGSAITALRAALAEPVQEPVAKVELMTTGGNAGLATRIVEIDDHLSERLRPSQLLYTAPPTRKPLTEEEMMDAFCKTPGIHQFVSAFFAGARYAELAHEII